ncbi:MAG: hypothetical protein ACOY94_28320 [Bacillota bacterium]
MRRRLGWAIGWVLLVGIMGPRLTPSGVTGFMGEQRRAAEQALQMAHRALENPLERLLLIQGLRVLDVRPLREGTTDHLGTGPCTDEVLVGAYTLLWIPYARVTVRCGVAGVTRQQDQQGNRQTNHLLPWDRKANRWLFALCTAAVLVYGLLQALG